MRIITHHRQKRSHFDDKACSKFHEALSPLFEFNAGYFEALNVWNILKQATENPPSSAFQRQTKARANPQNRETTEYDAILLLTPDKRKVHEQEKPVTTVTSNSLTTARLSALLINKIKLR